MIYLFDHNEDLIKIVNRSAIRKLYQTEVLNEERYVSDRIDIEMKAILSDSDFTSICYIAIPTQEDSFKYNFYYLARYKVDKDIVYLTGVQSAVEELKKTPVYGEGNHNKKSEYSFRPHDASLRQVAELLLQGSNWILGYVAETNIRSTNVYYYISIFDALKKICQIYDVEMQFFIEIDGTGRRSKIGARYIELRHRIGNVTGERVVYGHNAVEIVNETDNTEIYTALIGRGRGEQVTDGSDNASGKAGYGRKVTFKDVSWLQSKGDPIDKPLGKEFIENVYATQRYGIKTPNGMLPKFGFYEVDSEDPEKILSETYKALETCWRPKMHFKTTSAYLRGKIGDTVRAIRHDLKIDYDVRIFKIVWDRLQKVAVSIELGDRSGDGQNRQQKQFTQQLNNALDEQLDRRVVPLVDHLATSRGTTIWWGAEDPLKTHPGKVKIDDIWYQNDPENEGEIITNVYNGKDWIEQMRTKNWNVVNTQLQSLRQQAEELKKKTDLFTERIEKVDLAKISQLEKQIAERIANVNDTIKGTLNTLGNKKGDYYSRNRVKGETDRLLALGGEPYTVIEHNGQGYERGQTYTISFNVECVEIPTSTVTVRFVDGIVPPNNTRG